VLEVPFVEILVQGREPSSLAGSIFYVGRNEVVRGLSGAELLFHAVVQLRMRQARHHLDGCALLLLEVRKARVQRIVHRPAYQKHTERAKREGSKRGEQFVENTEAAKAARKGASAGGQPIEGYDEMNVEEVKDELDDLSDGDLKKVKSYEEDHKNRKTLLEQLHRKLGDDS
jgi:hypothetical protein